MVNKKLNHNRRVLGKEAIAKYDLAPGMVINFNYAKPNVQDNNPLVLLLGVDNESNLIHCINFNYLYEADVQHLFESISKRVNVEVGDVSAKMKSAITDGNVAHINYSIKVNPYKLYELVIKPTLLVKPKTKNCYRTYKISNIRNLSLVNYRFNIIEEQVRKDARITNYALKSAELFKALIEQEMEVKTDNVPPSYKDNEK
jgi:hypothetical protein